MNQSKSTKDTSNKGNDFIWTVLHDTGLLIQIVAVMSIPALIIALIFKEYFAIKPFILMGITTLVLGQSLRLLTPKVEDLGQRPLSMVVVALSWLIVVLLGVIPFYGIAHSLEYPNASVRVFEIFSNGFFESMSGFTSTGLSIVPDASRLPATLQFWRSLMEWVGGAGVVLMALLLIKPAEDAKKLYISETRKFLFDGSIKKTVKWIWIIYTAYTALSIGLFLISGMPLWEAINHGMTAIATGGFSITGDSFISYGPAIKIAAIFIIILGALSFQAHYHFWVKREWTSPWKKTDIRTFFGVWLFGILLTILIKLNYTTTPTWLKYLFEWSSALGTCGFSNLPLHYLNQPLLVLLILGMIIGGCSGSTTGGIKTNRVAWAIKAFLWRIKAIWQPGVRNISFFYDQKRVSQKDGLQMIETIVSLILLWVCLLFGSSFVLLITLHDQFTFLQVLFETSSALGSVGLSSGVVSATLPDSAKYLFSILMWMGRLEVMAVLIFFCVPNFYFESSKE